MRTLLALVVFFAFGAAGLAADIRVGATAQVKGNSIWFEDGAIFTRWQALKRGGDAKALAAFQEKALHERDAWQFINPHTVTILKVAPEQHRADVEMKTEGRLQGSQWIIDLDALEAAEK
jgi:hypothetical protein